jgi:HSP20 family protein
MGARYASLVFLSRFQAEIDRLFQEAVKIGDNTLPSAGEWQPSVDVVETSSSVLILAELPGVSAADVQVQVRGTQIVILGTKSTPLPGAQRVKFHCMERGHGRFQREVHLFSPVNTHHGSARMADGLLTIEFPKIKDKRQEARVLHIEEEARTAEAEGAGNE